MPSRYVVALAASVALLSACSGEDGPAPSSAAPHVSATSGEVTSTGSPSESVPTVTLSEGWMSATATPSDPVQAEAQAAAAAARAWMFHAGAGDPMACMFLTNADGTAPLESDQAAFEKCSTTTQNLVIGSPAAAKKLHDAVPREIQISGTRAVIDPATIPELKGEKIGLYLVKIGEDWFLDTAHLGMGASVPSDYTYRDESSAP